MKRLRSKLTYSNVMVTVLAFVVLGGGTALAASQFEKESIPNRALKKESIGPGKLTKAAKATLEGPKGAAGAKGANGATGATGPAGPAGAAGSAVAYAHVNADGTLDAANSKNIASTSLTAQPGYYCVLPSVSVKNVIAGGDGNLEGRLYNSSFQDFVTSCPDGAASVEVTKNSGGFVNGAFFIVFN
jgi:hypothetical protein